MKTYEVRGLTPELNLMKKINELIDEINKLKDKVEKLKTQK